MFQPVRQVSVNFADNEKQSNKTFNILYFMKTNLVNLALGLAFTGGAVSCQSQKNDLVFEHQGDTVTIVHIAVSNVSETRMLSQHSASAATFFIMTVASSLP